jgi:hypothetical protein
MQKNLYACILIQKLCRCRNMPYFTIQSYKAHRMLTLLNDYIAKSLHMNTVDGVHIRAMKLMRIGQNIQAMVLLEPAIYVNHFAFILYIDILLFGRVGIPRNLDKCEQLLYQRFGIDNSTEIDITSLLNLGIQYNDPNLLGLLYLLRKLEPKKYQSKWNDAVIVNAHLLAWSRGSLYGDLGMMITIMIERRFYVRQLKDDVLEEFKTGVFLGTAGEGCRYENYTSLARQINDKYNHPFAQNFLIKNLKHTYDNQNVPPNIVCEIDHIKQEASKQGFNEE